MGNAELGTTISYLVAVCALYLLPLLFSSRAKRSARFAAKVFVTVAVVATILASILYPIGAGLVGELKFGDYVRTVLFYTVPGFLVLCAWIGVLTLLGRKPS